MVIGESSMEACADFPGTVCAVTHDRYFLDNVAGWILELDQGSAYPFEGNYNQWLEAKAKRLEVSALLSGSKISLYPVKYSSKTILCKVRVLGPQRAILYHELSPMLSGKPCLKGLAAVLSKPVIVMGSAGSDTKALSRRLLLQTESQKETGLRKAINEELEWVRSNAKGQQKKGKARLRAFDELTQQVRRLLDRSRF